MAKAPAGAEMVAVMHRTGGDYQSFTQYWTATGDWQVLEMGVQFNDTTDEDSQFRVGFLYPEKRRAGECLYLDNVHIQDYADTHIYKAAAQEVKAFTLNNCYGDGRFHWTSEDYDTQELMTQVMGSFLLHGMHRTSGMQYGGSSYGSGLLYGTGSLYGTGALAELLRTITYMQNYVVLDASGNVTGYDMFTSSMAVAAEPTLMLALLRYRVARDVLSYVLDYQADSVCAYGAGGKFGTLKYGQSHGGVEQAFSEQVTQWQFKGIGATAWLVILLNVLSKTNNGELIFSGDCSQGV